MPIISLKSGTKSRSLLVGNPYFVPSSYESIATVTATGGDSFLEFSSIPSTYASLQIRGIAQDTNTGGTGAVSINIRFNSDSGSNYAIHELRGDGTSATAQGSDNYSSPLIYNAQWRASTSSSIFGVSIIDIHDYASTSKYKTVRYMAAADGNTGNTSSRISLGSALWMSTSAINTIRIIPFVAFAAGSTFALYGIKGA